METVNLRRCNAGYNTTYSSSYLKTNALSPCPNTLEFCRPVSQAHTCFFCGLLQQHIQLLSFFLLVCCCIRSPGVLTQWTHDSKLVKFFLEPVEHITFPWSNRSTYFDVHHRSGLFKGITAQNRNSIPALTDRMALVHVLPHAPGDMPSRFLKIGSFLLNSCIHGLEAGKSLPCNQSWFNVHAL